MIAFSLFAVCEAEAAVVYKWTDADGVVHFSDQAVPGAEKIVTSSGLSNGIGGAANTPAAPTATKPPAGGARHSEMTIESPAKDQVFFGDDIIPIRLHLEPALRPTESVVWHLNGKPLDDQAPDAISVALQALPRGAYSIAATVTDAATGEAQSSDSLTFYVRQPSELAPQHKKP